MAAIQLSLEVPAHFLDVPGQRAGFVLLAAFLGSFLFIRTSARLMRSPRVSWWPGSVTTESGLHLHHLVWGIVLILLAGFLGFAINPTSPWNEILAAMFGIGAGLTLDEFALWIYLRDVYWTNEGRSSFDAVVIAALIGGLVVLGFAPFDLHNAGSSIDTLALTVVTDVGLASVAILKGKPLLGLIGIFIPLVSLVGALRLAAPRSPWARWRYDPDGRQMQRSKARWRRIQARRRRVANAIAGAPSVPVAVEGQLPGDRGTSEE
ncbi:MAG: hypothetical protein WAK93_06450 [Solirubrobacteraceae bacterium]